MFYFSSSCCRQTHDDYNFPGFRRRQLAEYTVRCYAEGVHEGWVLTWHRVYFSAKHAQEVNLFLTLGLVMKSQIHDVIRGHQYNPHLACISRICILATGRHVQDLLDTSPSAKEKPTQLIADLPMPVFPAVPSTIVPPGLISPAIERL